MLGKRYDYKAKEIQITSELFKCLNKLAIPGVDNLLRCFPFLRHIPFWIGRYYQEFYRLYGEFLPRFYQEPKATFQPDISRGLLDVLFKVQDEARKQNEPCWLDDEDVKATVIDIYTAGILTTRSSLLFFILAILHHPEVARRMQAEIDTVVGSGRSPSLKDRSRMPYTEACILETLRHNTQFPLSIPHNIAKDVTFEGYHLPANTRVMANLWYVHHDPVLWDKPWEFRPQRFLDDTGNLLPPESENRRNMMAFNVGRRSCLGETFAKSRIFLYLTTLLQRFNFKRPNTGEEIPPLDPRQFDEATIVTPNRYKITVDHR